MDSPILRNIYFRCSSLFQISVSKNVSSLCNQAAEDYSWNYFLSIDKEKNISLDLIRNFDVVPFF